MSLIVNTVRIVRLAYVMCGALVVMPFRDRELHAQGSETPPVLSSVSPDTAGCDRQLHAEQMHAAGCTAAVAQLAMSDTASIGMHPVVHGRAILQHDSVVVVVDSFARSWLTTLQHQHAIRSRDLLNQAALQVQLGEDGFAQQSIEQWLASPESTVQDTLIALSTGIGFFTTTFRGPPSPARMVIARSYVARLEALPIAVAVGTLYQARFTMMLAYAKAGAIDSAMANGLGAIAILPQFPAFEERAFAAVNSGILPLARLLAGQPHGTTRVDSLMAVLTATIVPSPALLARDPDLTRLLPGLNEMMAKIVGKVRWFGRPMPALVATHWFNQPIPATVSTAAPKARALRLDDGVIRIIGFGWFTCGWCHFAMKRLQKDQVLLPKGVQIEFYEWTLGHWGTEFATPEEEVEHLRQYWLERKHFTFPIALWAGPKDGGDATGEGAVPRESPMHKALMIEAGPTFVVTDGHGIIRHWQEGYDGYANDFAKIIDQLVQERAQQLTAP